MNVNIKDNDNILLSCVDCYKWLRITPGAMASVLFVPDITEIMTLMIKMSIET